MKDLSSDKCIVISGGFKGYVEFIFETIGRGSRYTLFDVNFNEYCKWYNCDTNLENYNKWMLNPMTDKFRGEDTPLLEYMKNVYRDCYESFRKK